MIVFDWKELENKARAAVEGSEFCVDHFDNTFSRALTLCISNERTWGKEAVAHVRPSEDYRRIIVEELSANLLGEDLRKDYPVSVAQYSKGIKAVAEALEKSVGLETVFVRRYH